jgi:mono/diheme cytochrome c family protein
MKKSYRTIKFAFGCALSGLILMGLTSCGKKDENSPGVEFMPEMYRSPSLEVYNTHTVDGQTELNAKEPVKGTVARGYLPYAYANDTAGYAAAGRYLHNPLPKTDAVIAEGEVLYGKFCVHCHGATGAGDGKVGGKLPGPPPAYSSLKITEGKMFHTITYGKGTMGSHASQLTQEERWKLVFFVQKLQGPKEAPKLDSVEIEQFDAKGKSTFVKVTGEEYAKMQEGAKKPAKH